MAQWVKRLPSRHGDQSLNVCERLGVVYMHAVRPIAREVGTANRPLGASGQPVLLGEFQVSEPLSKTKVDGT